MQFLQMIGCMCSTQGFARTILDEKLDKDYEFPRRIILSDEAAF
jgi:hypothetical protein